MSITNGYCSLLELKARLGLMAYSADDTILENIVMAASRHIDSDRNHRFYATSETRYYTAGGSRFLPVDDLLSVTTFKTDADSDGTFETTWATTDYYLFPYNAIANGQPYEAIEMAPHGDYVFPTNYRGVQIVGSFGYSATTPPAIKEACLLMAMRIYARKDILFGVSGSAELGTLTAITQISRDGEIRALLGSIKKRAIA